MYIKLIDAMGADQALEIGLMPKFNESAKPVVNFIQDHTAELITQINDTTKKQIKNIIAEYTERGDSLKDVAKAITLKFDEFNDARAKMIAVTETTVAYGFSAREAMRQAGLDKAVWLTTMDGHERPAHGALNGEVSGDDGAFHIDGDSAEYPGGFASAALNINCRCAIRAYFEGEKSQSPNERLWRERDKKRHALEPVVSDAMKKVFEIQKVAYFKKLERYL